MCNHRVKELVLVLALLIPALMPGQTDSIKWDQKSYIKFLHTEFFIPDLKQSLSDQLFHHRYNVKYYPNPNWTLRLEVRSRLFYGELVKSTPDFAGTIDNANNDYLDMSWVVASSKSIVLHTMIDRLSAAYSKGPWDIRVGRQRINWGIHTFWNANDIFNAFSFTDFDYEERPGSDAILARYYFNGNSSVEVAAKAAHHVRLGTYASLWRFNQWNYDFQVLGGYFQNNFVAGFGWAGNLGTAGWKGEWSYFEDLTDGGTNVFTGATGIDYSFAKGTYVQAGFMINSQGDTQSPVTELFNFNLSAKNLYPYRSAVYLQMSHPISPLVNGGLSIIYSPVKSQPFFVNPTVSVSVAENWDLDLVGQVLWNKTDHFYSPLQAFFLRMKYSY
ncbi:MAG TPA: hypothetical protein P5275_17165 [Saprospiraceae bacterium]|nr:hypothetical protein [Saprospiraceae bacterium]HPG09455.1 hypothetical protein [Saprospiraceae bacterium]HQU51977.1 hypothetical protein [Saprospiraceae bacterium]HRV86608.1 hypothetical protein [Saprospiraceae bacterium]